MARPYCGLPVHSIFTQSIAGYSPMVNPFLANSSNSYLFYRQDTRYQNNPSVANLLSLIWKAMTIKKVKTPAQLS
jgi:hypothetical protein